MKKPEDVELEAILSRAAADERHAYKRAIIYTLIPAIIGLLFIGFSTYQFISTSRQVKKLEQSKQALTVQRDDLARERDHVSSELEDLKSRTANVRAELDELTIKLNDAKDTLRKTQEALDIATKGLEQASEGQGNPEQAQSALRSINTIVGGRWIVVGADRTLEEAQFEANKARRAGYNPAIYLRQNSYRTVIEFPSDEEAKASLKAVRARLNDTAYLRDLSSWCPNPAQQSGYFRCAN